MKKILVRNISLLLIVMTIFIGIIATPPIAAGTSTITATNGSVVSNAATATVTAVPTPISFNGTVRDFSTRVPIHGAIIEAMQNDIAVASTSTDSNGNYSLSLPSGNYNLRASASGYIMKIKRVVSTGTTVNFNLRSGKVLVFDEFVQQALNTSIWNSLTTGIGYIYFANTTYSNSNFTALGIGSGYGGAGSGSITSKTSVSLTDYDVLIFEGRINAYEDNDNAYGDKQPRGLRVGGDGNNAIELISATGSSIQARTVSSGVATTTNYNVGESVAQWKYVYRIEANLTSVKFYLNEILIATHTNNIPTGNLSIYMGTNYGGYGNVPIGADWLYLAGATNVTPPPPVLVAIQDSGGSSIISGASSSVVLVSIVAKNVQNLGAATVTLSYNPSVVTVQSVSSGALGTPVSNINNIAGTTQITSFSLLGKSGNVTIANLELKLVGSTGANSPLTLSVSTFSDSSGNSISSTVTSGQLSVVQYLRGDMNCDNAVNIIDALLIAQYSVGLRSAPYTC